MKKKIFVVISSTALLAITFSVSLLVSQKTAEKTEASSYSTNNVPTTIDLNDTTSIDIAKYYTNLDKLDSSERKGTNLLKNLKPILKNGQKYFSYGSSATTAVWQSYEIVDRDWDKSPAEDISGYDATTKIITGYTYGKSNTQTGTNPYIHALYVNRNVTNQTRAWGNHNQDQWGINQEHVWAKSCGFDSESPGTGARGDMMHLWAGNGKVNGQYHSNYYYGYVDTNRAYNDASEYASTLSGNRKGYSKTKGGSYTVFEPQDSDKGDIARAIFYMVARYNYLSGSDSDGIDAGNPNLEIVNQLNWAPGSSYTSSTSNKGQMGILQDLLEWNRLDPPDKWEIHRNNILYNNYTKNRNPFIDFPEWAEYIWGKSEDGNYSSTPTGYADPNTDVINGYKGDTPTPPDPIGGDSETITMSEQGFSNQQEITTIEGTDCSITFSKGTNSNTPKYYTTGSAVRAYGGNTFTVSSSRNIVGINLTFGSDDGSNEITTDKSAWSSPSWTGSANSVTFTIGGTSGNRRISAIEVIYESSGSDEPTSITATVNKNFSVGETISKSDITVKDNNNNVISDFSFANNNYKFTYNDAASGGALTDKVFEDSITYGELSCSVSAKVSRKAYSTVDDIDYTLNDFSSITTTKKTNTFSFADGSSIIATNSYRYSSYLSFGSYAVDGGYKTDSKFYNEAALPNVIKSVSYQLNSDVATPLIEYSEDGSDNSWSTTINNKQYFFKLSFPNAWTSGFINFVSFSVKTVDFESANNVANYIMFEDTNNQCLTKLDYAISYFNNMSATERNTFMTSDDYVISTARDRFDKWLISQGKSVSISGGDYVITANKNMVNALNNNNYIYLIITLTGVISISMVGFYFLLKKKRPH